MAFQFNSVVSGVVQIPQRSAMVTPPKTKEVGRPQKKKKKVVKR